MAGQHPHHRLKFFLAHDQGLFFGEIVKTFGVKEGVADQQRHFVTKRDAAPAGLQGGLVEGDDDVDCRGGGPAALNPAALNPAAP